VAAALVKGVNAAGGTWSEADLARYRAPERRPIVSYFRAWRLVLAPPPSASGVEVTEILQQLEARGWQPRRMAADDAMILEAMRRADRDRDAFLGDPDFVDVPLHLLRSMTYADWLARTTDPAHATPAAALPAPADIAPRPSDCPAPPAACGSRVRHAGNEGRGAALFTVIDSEGNRVAGTMTLGSRFGSGDMPPHSGVLLNDRLRAFTALQGASDPRIDGQRGNRPAARKRPLSSLGPAFVEGRAACWCWPPAAGATPSPP
jgi:Gamma-glutamyltransferase